MLRFAVAVGLIASMATASAQAAHRSVTVIGSKRDLRARALEEAIAFWNDQLEQLGLASRFDPPVFIRDPGVEQEELARMGESDERMMVPANLRQIDGDVVIVFATDEFPSFTVNRRNSRAFIAIRTADVAPLSRPNVARNVIAHELGHALGLDHNSNDRYLMCGRPAPCRPDMFIGFDRIFPLTVAEKATLKRALD